MKQDSLLPEPLEHIAIMKKSWGLIEKILKGEKTVESRWYKVKYPPWDRISSGDTLYFKNSGEPVSVKARVVKVLQFANLTPEKTKSILQKYGKSDLGTSHIGNEVKRYVSGKKYCILVFFDRVEEIKPFNIDKKGFGAMSAWVSTKNLKQLKKPD